MLRKAQQFVKMGRRPLSSLTRGPHLIEFGDDAEINWKRGDFEWDPEWGAGGPALVSPAAPPVPAQGPAGQAEGGYGSR